VRKGYCFDATGEAAVEAPPRRAGIQLICVVAAEESAVRADERAT